MFLINWLSQIDWVEEIINYFLFNFQEYMTNQVCTNIS